MGRHIVTPSPPVHRVCLMQTGESATALLAQGRVDISALVSHVLPIREAQQGFDACLNGQAVKVLFELES